MYYPNLTYFAQQIKIPMKIIKLNSTSSTNTFLKDLMCFAKLEDFTVVTARKQTAGRGQMDAKWLSQEGKNLTFSVYCQFDNLHMQEQVYLNFAVALSIFDFLKTLNLPNLAIKWPNDILTDKRKICGVLIENTPQNKLIKSSIIGIGLNVNQTEFPKELHKATSIKRILKQDFDLEDLLNQYLVFLQKYISKLRKQEYKQLKNLYISHLYMKDIPAMFKSKSQVFIGKILGVCESGKLQLELENESIKTFGVKEIEFLRR